MPPGTGPCTVWATTDDVCAPCVDDDLDGELLEAGLAIASEALFHVTGRRWPGECTDVVRPAGTCRCASRDNCGCSALSEIRLPGYPVVSVTEVVVDGEVLPEARYRVDNWRRLVYLPDPAHPSQPIGGWPVCQDMAKPPTEHGTWEVTYTFGQAPPPGGVQAAAALGCQVALACSPDTALAGKCRLPKRVTTITRQGTTIAVLDPMTLFDNGKVGLPEVDLWVAMVRLGDKRRRATAFVPGRRRPVRRAT